MPKIIVTEDQWIQAGIECFAQGGVEGLVIEKMSAALGCSKSSFYWYFDNRNEFIKRIVEKWVEQTTNQVILDTSKQETVDEQIINLLVQMFSVTRKGDFLFYLRKLSNHESAYCSMLDNVEQVRMEYAQGLFCKAGLPTEIANQKAWLLYHYFLGWYERHKQDHFTEEEVHLHVDMLRKNLIGI
ncbi:TetR/AcrR family transcriptional regulator [Paenibacillus sp. 481]|uniref:TetR/AcrR family transcriptional regulator n=1 Tax=Paenibacillus sp. 481 TaxID=2835869 RepID=UPI001E2E07D5|nr:TetR/AcrR family transcriptional regulator [Paenibacillus sp. 481]UHA75126.1 TetR/AcrR family transcriptional regulator [Paenibacillus sp. 481]